MTLLPAHLGMVPNHEGPQASTLDDQSRAHPVELFLGPYAFGGHTFQVRGTRTPVLEVHLQAESPILFEQHTLLWRDPVVSIRPQLTRGRRSHAGEEMAVASASGPGQAAFSPSTPSRVFMLYLPPEATLEVREHHWLCAASLQNDDLRMTAGLWMERFGAGGSPGLLVLYARGDVFELVLETGETLDLHADALLYKEQEVALQPLAAGESAGAVGGAAPRLLRCSGPGLIAVQTVGYCSGGVQ